jgi:hypothetical protein
MSHTITDLRSRLFETLDAMKAGTIELDQARLINDLAKTITDTARVEVEYLRATGGGESEFLDATVGTDNLPPGITGRVVHKLK